MNNPEKIIIHHSLTDDNAELEDFKAIRDYHINNNGWKDVGYHYVVEKINDMYFTLIGRDETEVGAHTKEESMNYKSLGICLVGNYDNYEPSDEALKELARLIVGIRRRYGKLPLEPHRKYATYKSCPGTRFPMDKLIDIVHALENHWAEIHWENLNKKGVTVHSKRFDDYMTRGEAFALIDRATDYIKEEK